MVFAKYTNFINMIFPNIASKLPKYNEINNYSITLISSQQPPHWDVYSLELIELKTLKAYIETNLINGFIKLFKSPTNAFIFFNLKFNRFLQLFVNYQGLNNILIKNWYLLFLIKELLNRLSRARQFSQLKFTSIYYQIRISKGDK